MAAERAILYDGGRVFYRVSGQGAAVVLLHGIPADGTLWNNQLKTLALFKLITPDLPGSGRSELISQTNIEGMAEAVKAILDEEGESQAVIIGHSLGGYVSLAFAEKYAGRLRGFGLFHSTSYPDSEERKAMRRNAIEFIKTNGAHEFLKTSVANLFAPGNREKNAVEISNLIEKTKIFSSRALISYYEAMLERPDRRAVLANLPFPVLLVAGTYDNAAPLNDILEQSHLPATGYLHVLSQSGHMGMLEEPNKASQVLHEYLEAVHR